MIWLDNIYLVLNMVMWMIFHIILIILIIVIIMKLVAIYHLCPLEDVNIVPKSITNRFEDDLDGVVTLSVLEACLVNSEEIISSDFPVLSEETVWLPQYSSAKLREAQRTLPRPNSFTGKN